MKKLDDIIWVKKPDFPHRSGSLDSKKKTEPGMRPILPSNLPISGIEFIEKQIF